MRRWFILTAVAAQVLVLAWMAAQREWVVRTGERVLVRTAPIDPLDPMRGYYARLDYEISTVPRSLCRDGVAGWFADDTIYSRQMRDRRVYAVLERDDSGVAGLVALTDREPTGGLFLRGRVDFVSAQSIRVRYGIEAMFMEQGRSLEFENRARNEMVGVPINAEVAIGSGGLGVLRDYHWEPLGISIRLVRRDDDRDEEATRGTSRRPGVIGATVTLKNFGDEALAIVDLPSGRSFHLVIADRGGISTFEPAGTKVEPPPPSAVDVILLQPGEGREIALDFAHPDWFVRKVVAEGESPGAPVALETLADEWNASFRIEYAPPPRDACVGLPHAEHIRHARLRSRMFTPGGGGD